IAGREIFPLSADNARRKRLICLLVALASTADSVVRPRRGARSPRLLPFAPEPRRSQRSPCRSGGPDGTAVSVDPGAGNPPSFYLVGRGRSLPPSARSTTRWMEMTSHAELLRRHQVVMPSWLALYYEDPIALVDGDGRRVTDAEGTTY